MKNILVVVAALFLAGCASPKPDGLNICCFTLHIQIGGSYIAPETDVANKLTNSRQAHTIPISDSSEKPNNLTIPVKP